RAAGSGGTRPDGTGATGGMPSGGTGAVAGTDAQGGAAGASSSSCDPLCGAEGCGQTQPACLAEAFGLTAGQVIPICVPQGSAASYTYCGATTCDQTVAPGCPLLVHIGTMDWQLAPVVLTAAVTGIEGSIGVTGGATCDLTVEIPQDAPLPAVAHGALEPVTAGQETLRLRFTSTDVDTSTATVHSDPTSPACNSIASSAFALAGTRIERALQDALNAIADPLRCLACTSDCPQQVACAGP
ncbi:MAG: hypothetical protein JW940_38095, partial [Polyangiaceae bacterium]|nr:hypothetical protein [Polyangiaceae bacterium]